MFLVDFMRRYIRLMFVRVWTHRQVAVQGRVSLESTQRRVMSAGRSRVESQVLHQACSDTRGESGLSGGSLQLIRLERELGRVCEAAES